MKPRIKYQVTANVDAYNAPIIEIYKTLKEAKERVEILSGVPDIDGPITLERITKETILKVKERIIS